MANLLLDGLLMEAKLWAHQDRQVSINTFHYQVKGTPSGAATDVEFLDQFRIAFATAFKALISAEATYDGCSIQVLTPPGGLMYLNSTGNGVGTGGLLAAPTQIAGLTSWQTSLGGRAYRGRTYWPFVPQEMIGDTGNPKAAYLTALDNFSTPFIGLNFWIMTSGSATIYPVLKHRKNKAGTKPDPTTLSAKHDSNIFATQKRRGQYGRPNNSPF